uniref:CEC3-2.2 n=1 Tax=Colletotrichum orbiculare TaxID=5465 RepID=A0A8A5KHG6_9PEZI|nr:CEC3-2.2 [Colletotrichum orbiculare]
MSFRLHILLLALASILGLVIAVPVRPFAVSLFDYLPLLTRARQFAVIQGRAEGLTQTIGQKRIFL